MTIDGADVPKSELFEDFAFKRKSLLDLQKHDYCDVMDLTSKDAQPIADDRLVTRTEASEQVPDSRRVRMPRRLK